MNLEKVENGLRDFMIAGVLLIVVSIGWAMFQSCGKPITNVSTETNEAYQAAMTDLVAKLSKNGASVTWPSEGLSNSIRIDLPSSLNGATVDWDDHSERKLASEIYAAFVNIRQQSSLEDPRICHVNVFDDTDKQVATADYDGVRN